MLLTTYLLSIVLKKLAFDFPPETDHSKDFLIDFMNSSLVAQNTVLRASN